MTRFSTILLGLVLFILAACGNAPLEPTVPPTLTPFPSPQVQATRTPLVLPTALPTFTPVVNNQTGVTPIVITATPFVVATQTNNQSSLLMNGRGLTNGQTVTNGEFQVEGYCSLLNPSYGVGEDGTDWFCTFNNQRALTLRADDFNEICRLTYNNQNAIAVQVNSGQALAFQWRCYELVLPPTPTSTAPPQLLNNGRGLTNGQLVTNGEFQVEGYCSAINPNYGVDEDGTFWYCTENGNRILTLGVAEFDDICIRTYNNPAAFAQQVPDGGPPAYQWRCFAIPS